MSRFVEWCRAAWTALDLDARDVAFYGGLALIGFASLRLAVVGGILVVHAVLAPLLVRRN